MESEAGLIARYLSGECTPSERATVEQRIANDRPFAEEVELLRAAWAPQPEAAYDASKLWDRVAADTVNAPHIERTLPKPHLVRAAPARAAWLKYGIAAALVLAVGGAGALVALRPKPVQQAAAPAPMREVATRRAQRAEVYLSDGTRVVVGVASKLRFASTFGSTRDVYLEGQAYFDVAHDARPFTVHTPSGVARDIGTKFGVTAYGDDRRHKLEVVVEEGIVALRATETATDSVLLRANELGRVLHTGRIVSARGVDAKSRLAWTVGRLEFRNVLLKDAIPQIARWYDIELRTDSVLASFPITLTLTGERFDEATNVLTRALDARMTRRGNTYVLQQAGR
jgi:transmembrane sensor